MPRRSFAFTSNIVFSIAWGRSYPRFKCPADGRTWQGDCLFALETPLNEQFIFGSRGGQAGRSLLPSREATQNPAHQGIADGAGDAGSELAAYTAGSVL